MENNRIIEEREFKSFFKQVLVCEDVYGHWLYWKQNLNANPDDCCNLRVVYKENPILKRK